MAGLVGLQQLVVALDPHHRIQVPRCALQPLAALSALTRFDMFDSAGQIHLTQVRQEQAAQKDRAAQGDCVVKQR